MDWGRVLVPPQIIIFDKRQNCTSALVYSVTMSLFDDFLSHFPQDLQDTIRSIWDALDTEEQKGFLSLIAAFPSDSGLVKGLIKLSSTQVRQAFGRKHNVVILGPANVGKSTLYNQMVRSNRDRAAVSPVPGTTRETQLADAGLFSVIDTPGTDSVGERGAQERSLALAAAEQADFLVLVYDAIQGIKRGEQELFHELTALKKPFLVVLNKIDLVSNKDLEGVTAQTATNLGLEPKQVIPVAAKSGRNLSRLLLAIAANEPAMIAALGQALPEYRWQLAWRSIISAASISAVIALAPLPVIDFIPLVITQSIMVLGIARIYNYRMTPRRATDLVTTFGLAFLARTIFQELSKFEGLPGWLLAAAIASSTTVVMGYAAILWFEKGDKLSSATLKKLTKGMTSYMLETLKGFGKRKPSRKELEARITSSLSESPLSESRKPLDDEAGP
jgi:small GTP-binding protein